MKYHRVLLWVGALVAIATALFTTPPAQAAVQASYTVGTGSNGETIIFVSGAGATVTLADIQKGVSALNPTADLLVLEDAKKKVWIANASIHIGRDVTLRLTSETVLWLKLRSQGSSSQPANSAFDYQSFAVLRTHNGALIIDGVTITSWDPVAKAYDTDITNGRSYVLAKYDARMDIRDSDLSYLGFADGESYGVSWRDINAEDQPNVLLTRVTGEVINSVFSYNYYGIYTYQASNMLFRGNTFHHNIGYGFDPHDFSHHFLVEHNQAFENGNHGFIISRGCNNFVLRHNSSYNNRYTVGTGDRRAHGFMIDHGSPNSDQPQVASSNNIVEHNKAYGNDGYGMRVLGSTSNTIQLNEFSGNLQGITIEQGSTDNLVKNNTITSSGLYGIYIVGGSDRTTVAGNTITKSGRHGIYIKTGSNVVTENTLAENGSLVDGEATGSGIATLPESDVSAARADLVLPRQRVSIAASAPELLSSPAAATEVTGNRIAGNRVLNNADEGIELKGATNTVVEANTVQGNGANGIYLASGARLTTVKQNTVSGNRRYGIRANGATVGNNTWTENLVYENTSGAIAATDGANEGIVPPKLIRKGNSITGTTLPGAVVEVFSDNNGQGRYFEARVTAAADGTFTVEQAWQGAIVNVVVTDSKGNSSAFAYNVAFFVPTRWVYAPMITRRP